jgi:hypothetical protein
MDTATQNFRIKLESRITNKSSTAYFSQFRPSVKIVPA